MINLTPARTAAARGAKKKEEPPEGLPLKKIIAPPIDSAPIAGYRKFRLRLSREVLRQASSGPIAVSSRSSNATGIATRLKKGGPTVTLCPWTNSERIGKNVPQSMVKQRVSRRRLLNRKLDSRETSASSLCSLLRCDRFSTRK